MRPWNWHRRRTLLRRRLTVAVMLATYLAASFGVPVPVRANKPDGKPFPCQHHACGCLTAQQCRENCCCYSAAQRMAWAQQHGIEPPAAWVAELAADAQAAGHDGPDQHSAPRTCCAHGSAPASCHDDHANHGHDAGACDDDSSGDARIVFSLSARACRAISSLWCTTGAVIVAPAVCWKFQWTVVEWISPFGESAGSRDLSPPVPPPRV
jgi:hypothetical protein